MNRRKLSFLLAVLFLLCSVSFHRLSVNAVTEAPQTRAAISHNLFYSDYGSASYYANRENEDSILDVPVYDDDGLQLRANCYGYAFRFFYEPEDFGADITHYLQKPGDFADKTDGIVIYNTDGNPIEPVIYNYQNLDTLYNNTLKSNLLDDEEKMHVIVQLMEADANTLGYTMTSCPISSVPTSQTYTTKRLIAVVVGGKDFHYYMQHSDGSWSHKQGGATPDNWSIARHALTNDTIAEKALEDSYAGGAIRFFYITKNSVIDYGHANGHYASCVKTFLYSTDGAGNDFQTSRNLGSVSNISKYGVIDFCGDVDYYYFKPTTTKTYTFTSTTSSSLPITITLYNASGTQLISRSAANGAVSFTYRLQSGTKYFIKVNTYNQTEHQYLRTYNFYAS